MDTLSASAQPMPELANYLATRREDILANWRSACRQDSMLSSVSESSHEEFNDLAPLVLTIVEQRLLGQPLHIDPALAGRAYGLRRWHRGQTLLEILRELRHLTQTLYDEFDLFEELFPDHACRPLTQAYRHIALTLQEMNQWTVKQYYDLQQQQALDRATTLQQAIDQLNELAHQRATLLRTSSHDLRNGLSLASLATQVLYDSNLSTTERQQYLAILARNLDNVHHLFTNLMDLSRLETGQERLILEPVEVGQLLNQLVINAQPLARAQRLVLRAEGPLALQADTDPVKLQRVVQNLLTNALKYSAATSKRPGFVSVNWDRTDEAHWRVSIQDTGPGLPDRVVTGLGYRPQSSLNEASPATSDVVNGEPVGLKSGFSDTPPLSDQSALQGEGIGLHIVKGLCELMGARLDVETKPGQGTLFSIWFPLTISVKLADAVSPADA